MPAQGDLSLETKHKPRRCHASETFSLQVLIRRQEMLIEATYGFWTGWATIMKSLD